MQGNERAHATTFPSKSSSARNADLSASAAHTTEIVRNVGTDGPDQRVMIAWPQRDGDTVDDNYTMKVYRLEV